MDFFTSDTHFFHEILLQSNNFSPRPYDNLEDFHKGLIQAWNERVTNEDVVYHLGDVAFLNKIKPVQRGYDLTLEILKELHGQIQFVKGNHDTRSFFKYLEKNNYQLADGKNKFVFHDVGLILKANGHQFFMTHYPLMFGQTQNSINLHGHIHNSMVNVPENINVGVDSADLNYLFDDERPTWGTPLSLAEIELIIKAKHDDFAKRR
ncbi:metallophosphatase [Weissella muntiaci]|uniref:Metallophosphatase n=1 Tax=Weissella muntiaci TaxID=2508881 RepID=A0A6C2C7D5_9LACO|nr:metallophosphoesterase family protein [Weissella muntiaci]TYC49858.1 metallophosphatase [Weissella muntiaci]